MTGSENAPGAPKAPSRNPKEILSHIRHAVTAIGFLRVPFDEYASDPGSDAFDIIGTGFVVGRGKVMTCHHVIADLTSCLRKRHLPHERAALLFVRGDAAAGEAGWTVKVSSIQSATRMGRLDLALVAFGPNDLAISPVSVLSKEAESVEVGEDVVLCGYAHGTALLHKDKRLIRFGPIVQRGCISALSPFDGRLPNEILLDLRTARSASGSPIFRPQTGDVIGVLVRGQEGPTATTSFALPVRADAGGILVQPVHFGPISATNNTITI